VLPGVAADAHVTREVRQNMSEQALPQVVGVKTVERMTGRSRTWLWRQERAGRFPRRLQLGPNSVGWLLSDIEEWMRTLPRGLGAVPKAS
jgi:prophage regulatory protein